MRKRIPLVVGGGVALLVASQYLNLGLGFRSGNGPVVSTQTPSSIPSIISNEPNDESSQAVDDESKQTPTESVLPPVVDVLIDGDQYLVVKDANQPETRSQMTLDEILAMTALVQGEESGIRIRIARTPLAMASAEAAILKQLEDAGVDADQIDARRQLVETNDN